MSLSRKIRLPPHDPATFGKLFIGESDRAAAVLGGSYLDGVLEQVLRSWMPPGHEKVIDEYFGPRGFLGTFGARKNMAFALGIIDNEGRGDLQRIANIRNFFAHHVLEAETFGHPDVRKEITRLSFYPYPPEWEGSTAASAIVAKWKHATPREFYLSAVEFLASRVRLVRVGPGPYSWEHFRSTVELSLICRADKRFTRYVEKERSEAIPATK